MLGVKTRTRLCCIHAPPVTDQWVAYTTYLARLLAGDLHYCDAAESLPALSGTDLVLLYAPVVPRWQRAWGRTEADQLATQGPASLLVARRPAWPVRRLLLVLRMEESDEAAIEWTRRLAGPAEAQVTVLPLLPSLPALYLLDPGGRPSLRRFLASSTPMAVRLQQLVAQFDEWEIAGAVSLRTGEPVWQIREEMAEQDYDLLVIGADPPGRLYRLLVGDLVAPLLRYARRPLLIAQQPAGEQAPGCCLQWGAPRRSDPPE